MVELLAPWESVEEKRARALEAELARELADERTADSRRARKRVHDAPPVKDEDREDDRVVAVSQHRLETNATTANNPLPLFSEDKEGLRSRYGIDTESLPDNRRRQDPGSVKLIHWSLSQ